MVVVLWGGHWCTIYIYIHINYLYIPASPECLIDIYIYKYRALFKIFLTRAFRVSVRFCFCVVFFLCAFFCARFFTPPDAGGYSLDNERGAPGPRIISRGLLNLKLWGAYYVRAPQF